MKKYQTICLLLVALLVTPAVSHAAQVELQAAQHAAQRFVQKQAAGKLMSSKTVMTLAHAEPATSRLSAVDYYVFNATDGNSFVIVSGDDRAQEILAYGDGSLDMSDIPCNMQSLLDSYKEQMEYLHAHPGLQVERETPSLTASSSTCLPLLTCDWSQRQPYNDQCPKRNGERCVTGCVATAMAQVMYYWRFPIVSPSVPPLTLSWISLPSLPATTFMWNDMMDTYTGYYSPAQGEAVATLMRYCGQACSMNYGVDGSGTQVRCQRDALRLMGYNRTSMVNRSDYAKGSWFNMMMNELSNARPVLFSGSGSEGGHAYVVDGYDAQTDKFHINWGWAARGNGYFALDAFTVEGMSFNSSQQMLINVYPTSYQEPTTLYDFEVDGVYYRYGSVAGEVEVACRDDAFGSYQGDVVVPSVVTVDGRTMTVTGVGKSAFRNSTRLLSVTLPSTIRYVDDYAFRTCSAMTTVNLPAGVETIGNQSFTNCVSLKSVYISSSVREIGNKSFFNCTGMEHVDIDDIQSWIDVRLAGEHSSPLLYGHRLFIGGEEIKHLVLPTTLTAVPDYKFNGFSGMTSITLPQGLTTIGRSAFAGCSSLEAVEFPDGLEVIGVEAFKNCTSLQHLEFSLGIRQIGGMAFAGCSGMTTVGYTVTVPVSGTDAFDGCTALSRVDVPDINVWLNNGFVNASSNPLRFAQHLWVDGQEVTDLVIPDTVTAIKDYTFYNFTAMRSVAMGAHLNSIGASAFSLCKGLEEVIIPDVVTVIGEKAFSTCSGLKSLTIGAGASAIGDRAFHACIGLNQVICRSTLPPVANEVIWFSNSTCSQATLMVPESAVADYQRAIEWKRFGTVVGYKLQDLPGDVNADGEVTIADVNMLLEIILSGSATRGSVDVNGDGEVNLADVNAVIDLILNG